MENQTTEQPAGQSLTPGQPAAVGGQGTLVEQPPEHKVFPPFDPTWFASQFVWLVITFAILYVLMAKVAIPRIGGILATRRGRINGDLAAAEQAKASSEAAMAGYEKALAAARADANGIAEEARTAAKTAADAKRAGIEADLGRQLAAAEARIADIKAKALSEVGAIAGEATGAIVKTLIDTDVGKSDVDAAVATAMGK
jgi:F-type H+-transporting ATPase subunit b